MYYGFTDPSLFSLLQVLLTAELLINCDEAGRNKLEEILKDLVVKIDSFKFVTELPVDP